MILSMTEHIIMKKESLLIINNQQQRIREKNIASENPSELEMEKDFRV